MIRRFLLTLSALIALTGAASAQSGCPSIINGAVLTAAQWNACFQAKQNTLSFPPLNTNGGAMLGRLNLFPATAAQAGLNVGIGLTPSSPIDGDMWMTSVGIFARINGATIGPFSTGSGGSFAATSPLAVSFPSGVTTYACSTCAVVGQPLSQFAATTSAQLRGVISDETGTGSAVFGTSPTLVTPSLGTPSAINLANATNVPMAQAAGNLAVSNLNSGASASSLTFWRGDGTWAAPATTNPAPTIASLANPVTLNNATYVDGPVGTNSGVGTWFASTTVTLLDTAGSTKFTCKLWDGTTVIDSGVTTSSGANLQTAMSLSGILPNPATNIKISCLTNAAGATTTMRSNDSGVGKDTTITTWRLQ